MSTGTATTFDVAGATRHCQTGGRVFQMIDMTVDELGNGLSTFEKGLSTAMSKVDKALPESVLTSVIAFARMLDIARMKGQCELAIYKKYQGYAAGSLKEAKDCFGFVRGGIEVLENEMFFR